MQRITVRPLVSRFLIFVLALASGGWALSAGAAQTGAAFNVAVTLQAAGPRSAFCRSSNSPGSFGATVTVVCSTGAFVDISANGSPLIPVHGGAYRFMFPVSNAGEFMGTLDEYTGFGTVISWRRVNLANRDYLELLLGW